MATYSFNLNRYNIAFSLFFLFVFTACKDKSPAQPQGESIPTGTLLFHLHTYIENNEVDLYNTVYTTDEGRKISLSLAQLYVSDIRLIRLDGTILEVKDRNILKVFDTDIYKIADVPVGNYRSISFAIGLDAITNASDPAHSPDSAILNRREMWLDAASAQPDGYVFVNAQGKIDTTFDATGSAAQMQPFSYRIGTNAHYTHITMPDKPYTIVKDQVEYAHVLADYNKLFAGVALNNANNLIVNTKADNSAFPGTRVAANIASMFSYEE